MLRQLIALSGAALIVAGAILATPPTARAQVDGRSTAADLVSMAQQAEAAGENRFAIALYREAHEAFPAVSGPLTGWGLLAARLGAADQAATLLSAALDVNPDDVAAAAGLAEVLIELDRPAEALVLFDSILDLDPSDPAALDGRRYVLSMIEATPQQTATPAYAEAVPLGNVDLVSGTILVDAEIPQATFRGESAGVWR